MRRIVQTQCVLKYDTKEQENNIARQLVVAEVFAGIFLDPSTPYQLEVIIFDNFTDYRSAHKVFNPKEKEEDYEVRKILSKTLLRSLG